MPTLQEILNMIVAPRLTRTEVIALIDEKSWATILSPSTNPAVSDDQVLQAAITANATNKKPILLKDDDGTGYTWKKFVWPKFGQRIEGNSVVSPKITVGGPYHTPGLVLHSSYSTPATDSNLADADGLCHNGFWSVQPISLCESPEVAASRSALPHIKFTFRWDASGPDPQYAPVIGLTLPRMPSALMTNRFAWNVSPYGATPTTQTWSVTVQDGTNGTTLNHPTVLTSGQTYTVEFEMTDSLLKLTVNGVLATAAHSVVPAYWQLQDLMIASFLGPTPLGRTRNVEVKCGSPGSYYWIKFPLIASEWDGPCFRFYKDAGSGYTLRGWGAPTGGPYRGAGTGPEKAQVSNLELFLNGNRTCVSIDNCPDLKLSRMKVWYGSIGIRNGGYGFDSTFEDMELDVGCIGYQCLTNAGYGYYHGGRIRGAEIALFCQNDYGMSLQNYWCYDSERGVVVDGQGGGITLNNWTHYNEGQTTWTQPLMTLFNCRTANVFGGWLGKPGGGDLIYCDGGATNNFYGLRHTIEQPGGPPGDPDVVYRLVNGATGALFGGRKETTAAWSNNLSDLARYGVSSS